MTIVRRMVQSAADFIPREATDDNEDVLDVGQLDAKQLIDALNRLFRLVGLDVQLEPGADAQTIMKALDKASKGGGSRTVQQSLRRFAAAGAGEMEGLTLSEIITWLNMLLTSCGLEKMAISPSTNATDLKAIMGQLVQSLDYDRKRQQEQERAARGDAIGGAGVPVLGGAPEQQLCNRPHPLAKPLKSKPAAGQRQLSVADRGRQAQLDAAGDRLLKGMGFRD